MNTFPELVSLSCLEEIILQSKKSIGKIEKKMEDMKKVQDFFVIYNAIKREFLFLL